MEVGNGESLRREPYDTTYRVIIVCYFANEILENSASYGSYRSNIQIKHDF